MSKSRPLIERIMALVEFGGGEGECWEWKGAKGRSRGGRPRPSAVRLGGRGSAKVIPYRVILAWATAEEQTPEGVEAELELRKGDEVLHSCDNTLCCNPEHLDWGGRRDNARDYVDKYGRF